MHSLGLLLQQQRKKGMNQNKSQDRPAGPSLAMQAAMVYLDQSQPRRGIKDSHWRPCTKNTKRVWITPSFAPESSTSYEVFRGLDCCLSFVFRRKPLWLTQQPPTHNGTLWETLLSWTGVHFLLRVLSQAHRVCVCVCVVFHREHPLSVCL